MKLAERELTCKIAPEFDAWRGRDNNTGLVVSDKYAKSIAASPRYPDFDDPCKRYFITRYSSKLKDGACNYKILTEATMKWYILGLRFPVFVSWINFIVSYIGFSQAQIPSTIAAFPNLTVGFPTSSGISEIISFFAFSCGT